MCDPILKLDRDRKLLNADVTWTQQFDRKSVEPVLKHANKCEQIIIPEHNAIILFKLHHSEMESLCCHSMQNLNSILADSNLKCVSHPECLYIIWVSLESAHMTSEHWSFLLPTFESGFRCSRNGGPPVIWISSWYLWYQVYFVIIIVEYLVIVLSVIYFKIIPFNLCSSEHYSAIVLRVFYF